jgi:phage FluMu protein Com
MKPETKSTIFIVIVTVLFISILIGLFTTALYLYTGNLWFNLSLVTGIVLSVGYLYNLYIIQNFNKFIVSKQVEIIKEQQKAYFNIECCGCGEVSSVAVNFSQDMVFKCEQCDVVNKVFYALKTGRTTDIPRNLNVVELVEKYIDGTQPPA